jgi:hypothetical protein
VWPQTCNVVGAVIKDWQPTSANKMPLSLAQAMRLSDVNEHAAKPP